jgi:flagellar hook-associated protein 3 FlgL
MRVTENTNFETVRNTIARTKGRMEQLQLQHSTLKKLNAPSDSPVAAAKVLETRTDKVNNDQYQMNAQLAEAFLNNTDHALGELSDIIIRAKEIAIGQSSGASSNEDTRLGIAEEVTQLYQHAISIANRRIGDRYLFGGYRTDRPPVDADGRYQGDDGQIMVEIGRDVFIATNVPGHEAFNTVPRNSTDVREKNGYDQRGASRELASTEDSGENVNLFDELQRLRIALLTGDLDGIRDTLDRFDGVHSRIVASRARVGSRVKGLEAAMASIERQNLTNAQLTQNLEDADMAQVVSDLAKEETVFRSALSSSQKLVQPTLLDFLK